MNIALVDLNLLVVFDAVMREKHVTRAAKRIGMTQPAVSNALNRLRYIAKDDLFVRSAKGVVPTSRALELGPPIRQAINLVENAFARIKQYRAISTRYDKLERNYASMVSLAFMLMWLPMYC